MSHEPPGLLFGGSAAFSPVRSEVVVGDLVGDDVVVGDEDVVPRRADRFLGAAPATDLGVMGGQVGALAAGCDLRGLGQRDP